MNRPSLDEEVAELAKQKLLKLMHGFLKALTIFLMVNVVIVVRSASWIPMMRLEAEASAEIAECAREGVGVAAEIAECAKKANVNATRYDHPNTI